ncbi:YDG domain-containing protein, partial [Chromobacterium alticapitis]
SGVNKVYDGSTAASAKLVSAGIVSGDDVSLSGAAVFADKNAGSGKMVTVSGIASNGADAGNYALASNTASAQADISAKQITVSASGMNKVYDGSTAASAKLASAGIVSGDDVSLSGAAAFADKSAGSGKTVSVTGIRSSGSDAGNYALASNTASAQADISAKQITISASGINKVYDGSTAASAKLASAGIVSGDDVSFSGAAAFADKNAGTGKTVTVSGIAGRGADAGNYALASTSVITQADITPKPLGVALVGLVSKLQDGNADAALSGANYQLTGLIDGERVSVTRANGSYDTLTPGTGKTVRASLSASDFSAESGTRLDNYALAIGPLAAAIGEIKPSGNPAAVNAAVTSNPGLPSGSSVVLGFVEPASWMGAGSRAESGEPGAEATSAGRGGKPHRTASLASSLPVERNGILHAFSIDEGGLRLPAGVKNDD